MRRSFYVIGFFSFFINLLMLTGTVLGAAYLAKGAAAASAAGGTDPGFLKEKVATTAFYCAHVLPRICGKPVDRDLL